MRLRSFVLFVVTVLASSEASSSDEIPLYNSTGSAVAYVALDEEMTIYLWDGKPVAYLDAGGFDVYGFNGTHLGWFIKGAIWDHEGAASCAVKERIQFVNYEPHKGFKQFKPFKSYKQFAPFRPFLKKTFGHTPCQFLLAAGQS